MDLIIPEKRTVYITEVTWFPGRRHEVLTRGRRRVTPGGGGGFTLPPWTDCSGVTIRLDMNADIQKADHGDGRREILGHPAGPGGLDME